MAGLTTRFGRESGWNLRTSAAPYLSVLIVATVMGDWSGEIWPGVAVWKAQAPAVLIPIAGFGIAGVLWLVLRWRTVARGWLLVFLGAFAVTWLANLLGHFYHSDMTTHIALLFVPVLAMIAIKPPTLPESVRTLIALAWSIAITLVAARLLEMFGVLSPKYQTPALIEFDESYYWLPLNDFLGIEGRWPGPFGHNGFTAMMGAFIIVIAIAFWSRSSWVFLIVGGLALVVTSGRASVGAAIAGIVIVAMLSTQAPWTRIPRRWRVGGGAAVLALGTVVLFTGRSGLTGRQNIWPAFYELWLTSPWWGVGGTGIQASDGLTGSFLHAHNLYLDTLTRYGIWTFLLVIATLLIGLGVTLAAGLHGYPGPLALVVAYLITGITEPRNDWIHPGTLVLMVIISVMAAGSYLRIRKIEDVDPPVPASST